MCCDASDVCLERVLVKSVVYITWELLVLMCCDATDACLERVLLESSATWGNGFDVLELHRCVSRAGVSEIGGDEL